jgi:hypothetical protein
MLGTIELLKSLGKSSLEHGLSFSELRESFSLNFKRSDVSFFVLLILGMEVSFTALASMLDSWESSFLEELEGSHLEKAWLRELTAKLANGELI